MHLFGPVRFMEVWYQGAVLGLAVLVGMQGLPFQQLVEYVAPTQCICQTRGYCPHSRDGAESCDHHDHTAPGSTDAGPSTDSVTSTADSTPSQVVLRSCDSDPFDAVAPLSPVKWVVMKGEEIGAPLFSFSLAVIYGQRASQRTGDDIFHPPRLKPVVSPAGSPRVGLLKT